jgi:signal transduction histidine kinase
VALFRIFQETLTNIAKHANASTVHVDFRETDGWLELEVRDNGRGISREEMLKPKSFGIRGMVERASNLGGKVEISSAPGQGTTLSVRLPLTEGAMRAVKQQKTLI